MPCFSSNAFNFEENSSTGFPDGRFRTHTPCQFAGAWMPLPSALVNASLRLLDPQDLDHVGADAVDHRAAWTMRLFISRTASRMPTKRARLTMACPICSSLSPCRRATGSTLK